jgi:Rps23 Pro-64 3,4-dihydroxylase Tpa1-like proline 4-hydroxylase
MTAREMIDSLSGTLLCDERILSVSERELLANLLQRTRKQTNASDHAVAETITHTVGEIIAERALGVLGESMTRQLLQQQLGSSVGFLDRNQPVIRAGTPGGGTPPPPAPSPGSRPPGTSPPPISAGSPPTTPPPPSPGSRPPGTSPPPISAGSPPATPPPPAPGSRPPGTSPPPISFATTTSQPRTGGIAVLDAPAYVSAECVVLDEFLTFAELNSLRQFVLQNEMQFEISEVLSPGVSGGAVDYDHRRSHVLMDLCGYERTITDRVLTCLPRVLEKWGRDPFPISRIETQATASNHGDFFHCHSDNGAETVAAREITFVYFFHREPKPFSGGELRIYDSRRENDCYVPTANYRTIVPEQNQLVLFASGLSHEITPVDCPSGKFVDSRFTVNGWVHKCK